MRNRVRFLVRFGLLGIFLNVICGWFLVGVVSFPISDAQTIVDADQGVARSVMVMPQRGGTMVMAGINGAYDDLPALAIDDERMPAWSRLRSLPAYERGELLPRQTDMGYGWPMLSLSMSYDTYFSPMIGTIVSEQVSGVIPGVEFPIRVIPLGFAINSLLFALAGWLVVMVLHMAQVSLRRCTGRCPHCAVALPEFADGICPTCEAALGQVQTDA